MWVGRFMRRDIDNISETTIFTGNNEFIFIFDEMSQRRNEGDKQIKQVNKASV